MCSLVEAEGSVATERRGPSDCKINFLVDELSRFDMSITEIRESKWFYQGVYNVGGFVLIHSGRPLPSGDNTVLRNKGVGIECSKFHRCR